MLSKQKKNEASIPVFDSHWTSVSVPQTSEFTRIGRQFHALSANRYTAGIILLASLFAAGYRSRYRKYRVHCFPLGEFVRANRQKSRNASYMFVANFFASQTNHVAVLCILTIFCRFKPKNVCIFPKFSSFQFFQRKIILAKCCKEVIVPLE